MVVIFVVVVHPFRIKYGITISKRYVTHMSSITPFITKRYICVGRVEKHDF